MKKSLHLIFTLLLLATCVSCGRQNSTKALQSEFPADPANIEQVTETALITSTPSQVIPHDTEADIEANIPNQQENALYIEWDGAEEDIIPDMGDTAGVLQFTNDNTLFINPGETLPLYAIDIRRDSTYQYLLQIGMEDVTVLEYIEGSMIKTQDQVSLQYRIPAHPEYDLYMEYSISGAYWDFALVIK